MTAGPTGVPSPGRRAARAARPSRSAEPRACARSSRVLGLATIVSISASLQPRELVELAVLAAGPLGRLLVSTVHRISELEQEPGPQRCPSAAALAGARAAGVARRPRVATESAATPARARKPSRASAVERATTPSGFRRAASRNTSMSRTLTPSGDQPERPMPERKEDDGERARPGENEHERGRRDAVVAAARRARTRTGSGRSRRRQLLTFVSSAAAGWPHCGQ